jgi:hypothetical protein
VKLMPLLATPPTVTTTQPVVAPMGTVTPMLVALQLVTLAAVPLKVTVLVPWLAPKVLPVIVTAAPAGADAGDRLVMEGATVKLTPLLASPPTVTTTLPVVAPLGTVTPMLLALQLSMMAAVPLNVTVLVPWLAPKLLPMIVTAVPPDPEAGDKLAIKGEAVKLAPLLPSPPTVTTTLPVVAPLGAVTPMLLALQLVTLAAVPLKVTVLVPWLAPKLPPVIVTAVPTGPEVGDRLVIQGATVKLTPLLASPPTVATTLPVVAPLGTDTPMLVALQLVTLAAVPLKVTVLVPWLHPKLLPPIPTVVPTCPEGGDRLVIQGATVKLTPLLARPPTVTTTLPVVAPLGTVTAILLALQLVTLAAVPLKVTVLVPWLAPKLLPVMVTAAPTDPEVGDKLAIKGETVKPAALLATPPTVTTTL